MGIPRQEYWIGLPFPSPEDLPDPGIKLESPALLTSPALQADTFLMEPPGKPISIIYPYITYRVSLGAHSKESACNVGDPGSILGSRRSHGEGNGYPLQYSCLKNPRDKGAWWATVHGVGKSQTRLSD